MVPFEEIYIVRGEDGPSVVVVESTQDKCTYRIEYVNKERPIVELIATFPYKIKLE